jgi:SRSO17 transposase
MSLLDTLVDTNVPLGVMLADADFGDDSLFHHQLSALGISNLVGTESSTVVRLRGEEGNAVGAPRETWSPFWDGRKRERKLIRGSMPARR